MERCEVIIVGSGPAGSATALHLLAGDAALAGRIVVLEKARHPRDKTCAGGVIPKAVQMLAALGIPLSVPHARVDGAGVRTPVGDVRVRDADICRVVRRREFDALLAWTARDRGAVLREEERVVDLTREGSGVRVETERGTYWAPVVVGADGSGSRVRRALVGGEPGRVGRAVMCDVPIAATSWDGHAAHRYDFDFRSCRTGLRGYRWVFPAVVGGVPHANVGVYALPPTTGARLDAEITAALGDVGATSAARKAFPIRTFTRGTSVAAPHALLVGDAAGVDPLMGEGISFALEYGRLAATAILAARATGDWSFGSYAAAVHGGALGRKLAILHLATRVFYGRLQRLAFRVAATSPRAQAIGLRWFNGVGEWDERGMWGLVSALALGRPPL